MPTYTTMALDRLIEPKASKSMAAGKNASGSRQGSGINGTDKQPALKSTKITDRKHHWTQISPALYATPEPTPLPDSPLSFPPSPYIVNHKRRGPRLSKTFSEDDAALRQALPNEKTNEIVRSLEAEDVESFRVVNVTDDHNTVEDSRSQFVINGELGNDNNISNDDAARQDDSKSVILERDSEIDDFFDPQDSLSVRSSIEGESNYGLERSLNLNTSVSEFYDAWEELSSESGSQPLPNDVEAELRELRLSLLVEMEKRKQVEDLISDMQSQWGRICKELSLVGLNLPADPTMLEDDLGEDLSHQLHIIRFVSNSIGSGVAKAELGVEMEAQLESKNFEIARLLDRLRYYEAVNHEMFQRNQETIETMRRLRQRRKRRQRWIWGSIVTLGSAALVWSYFPTGKGSSSTDPYPSHTSEGSGSAQ